MTVSVAAPTANPTLSVGVNTGMQGSNYSLQGTSSPQKAGSISIPTYNPQQTSSVPLQGNGSTGGSVVANFSNAVQQNNSAISAAQNQANQLMASIKSLLASLQASTPPPIDLASINAQARQMAQNAVNPLYVKKLNNLLAQEAHKRSTAQEDYATSVQNAQDILNQTLEASQIGRGRATEDTATALAGINTEQDRNQTDQGTAFDLQRIADAAKLADSGLIGSGQGNQATIQSEQARNTLEARQGEDAQNKRVATEVLKARTFEDLARSDVLATSTEGKSEKASKVNLDRLLWELDPNNKGSQAATDRTLLEAQRYIDLQQSISNYGKKLVNNFIQSISNPRQRVAAAQAYGGFF